MSKLKIRYLTEKTRGGRTMFYWTPSPELRADGWNSRSLGGDRAAAMDMAERLNAELDAWREGDGATADTAAGSVADMIRKYRTSRFFTGLKPTTKRGYLQNLQVIEKWAGTEPVRRITPADVQKLYEAMREGTPAKANAVIRTLRLLFEYGRRSDMIEINPAARPGLVATEPRLVIWTNAQLAAMVAAADKIGRPSIGTAIMISAFLGQRQGDVIRMTWDKYQGGRFAFRQGKTNAPIDIPAIPELEVRIADRALTPAIATTIISSEITKRPYIAADFRHQFAKVRAAAAKANPELGLENIWYLDLRRTAVVWLAEEGATDEQISAVTGHKYDSTKQILEIYLPRRGEVAKLATDLLAGRRERLALSTGTPN